VVAAFVQLPAVGKELGTSHVLKNERGNVTFKRGGMGLVGGNFTFEA